MRALNLRTFFAPMRPPLFQFMVAGGLAGSADRIASPTHVADLAQLALAMRDVASRFSIGGQPLEVLGGIHVGRISAGVIGQTLPRYRCFGDTVRASKWMPFLNAPFW